MFIHPNADLWTVINHEGMQAETSYAVYDRDTIYAFDAVGAQVAVKAIKSGFLGRSGNLKFVVHGHKMKMLSRHDALEYVLKKETILQGPNCYRYHFKPASTPDDPFIPFWGIEEQVSETEMFYRAFQKFTSLPIIPAWAGQYFKKGIDARLIMTLKPTGNLGYAYLINNDVEGLSQAINEIISYGRLTFDSEIKEAA